MKKIKVYTSFNERNKIHYYRDFEISTCLPEVGDVIYGSEYDGEMEVVTALKEVHIDTCQGDDNVYNYDFFEVETELRMINDDDEWYVEEIRAKYVAIEKKL